MFIRKLLGVFLLLLICLFWTFPGIAQNEPGTVESISSMVKRNTIDNDSISLIEMSSYKSSTFETASFSTSLQSVALESYAATADSSSTNLQPVVSETGFISLSIDALGIAENTEGNIQVNKPSSDATVRAAYLASADVWGSNNGPLPNGAVILNGEDVNWDAHVFGGPNHAWADVTSIIAPVVDDAPAGLIDITLKETIYLDGSILAVIFDDPNQVVSNTVVLLFGAQQTTGDTFNIGLADPLDKSDPNLILDLSLGISYGYQGSNYTSQQSNIDINDQRLTSCAGGQDDSINMSAGNGFLITAGGIGDSNTNPPDPYACPSGPDWDDELYTLLPYVNTGDTAITIDTINPSNDDSIYFAALFLGSTTAVVGEGIVVSPPSATHEINTAYSVTATVRDDNAAPVVGRDVTFTVISGPHAEFNKTIATNSEGKAVYTYTGTTVGTDAIVASFDDSQGDISTSNEAVVEWVPPPNKWPVAKCKDVTLPLGSNGQAVLSPSQVDDGSYDPDEDPITFDLSKTNFNCSDIGASHEVTLTVTDDSDASDACTATVTVVDNLPPVPNVNPLPQVTGQCSAAIPAAPTATDNCAGTVTGTTSDPLSYNEQGTYTVTWTFDDGKGNTATQPQQVVVQDTVAPTVITKNITVELDENGNASISVDDIDNGSTDNCCLASKSISKSNFTCADLGENTVTLTVNDCNGNSSTAPATVTVEDNIAPVVKTKNITVELDADGNASITPEDIDDGSTDNCGIASMTVAPSEFTCSDLDGNTVTLTVIDNNGNVAEETAAVTVLPYTIPVSITGVITDKPKSSYKDVAVFKITGVTDIGTVAMDAAAAGTALTFEFRTADAGPLYSFTADSFDAAGNRMIYSDTEGNMVRCIFSTERCVVRLRYVDVDGNALDTSLPGDMTVNLQVGCTKYSNTGDWQQYDSGSGTWTKYRKDS